ncbi:MAG: hypothetical protein ACK5AO_02540, partial [bacterium]
MTEPSWDKAAFLALDIGAAIVPGVTGAGMAARAAKAASHVDHSTDAIKAVDAVEEVATKTDNVTDAIKVEENVIQPHTPSLDEIKDSMPWQATCNCFVEGTLVSTANGEKPIESIA